MEVAGQQIRGDEGAPPQVEEEYSRDAGPWIKMIMQAEQVFDDYFQRCDNVAKLYASLRKLASERADRQMQMFFANMQVMMPSIYSRPPRPVVVQRFRDAKNQLARKGSEVLERALVSSIHMERAHDAFTLVRDNLALFGRGVLWERYEAKEDGYECVRYEWVQRRDFLHEPARCWTEVGWTGRRSFLTEEEGKRRFKEKWQHVTYTDSEDTAEAYKVEQKAPVWEIWHKRKNVVVWINPQSSEVLDIAPPHLALDGFFPCPRPAYGTVEPDSLIPVPDVMFYKDQLEEINEMTARISALAESLKLVGFYPAGAEDVGPAIETAIEQMNTGEHRRTLVPVAGVSGFGSPTALKDAIVWMPIGEVVQAITACVQLRKQLIEDVYQISGISDIMRGDTNAQETLGAQQLKSQYGSIRIRDRQAEMVRIAEDAIGIAAEIMAEEFSPESIQQWSQSDLPRHEAIAQQFQQAVIAANHMAQQPGPDGQPNPQAPQMAQAAIAAAKKQAEETITIDKIVAMFREEKVRPYMMQVATDSTIQPDEMGEKAARSEFGTAFAQTMQVLGPLVAAQPDAADFAGKMLQFMLAPFRAGREMDQAIDDFTETAAEKVKQAQQGGGPQQAAQQQAQADMQMKQAEAQGRMAELQIKGQQAQIDAQMKAEQAKMDAATRQQEAQARMAEMQARLEAIQLQARVDAEKFERDRQLGEMQLQMKQMDLQLKAMELQAAQVPEAVED